MAHNPAAAPEYSDVIDSAPTTPYASGAPLNHGYYYSAPSSPTHFLVSTAAAAVPPAAASNASSSFDFDFDFSATGPSSADELFCNGRIRPTNLSAHSLDPLTESMGEEELRETLPRGGSMRRRSRSMSPIRSAPDEELKEERKGSDETTTSRAIGRRSSRRWVFLKVFPYRCTSEGRRNVDEGHNSNSKRKTKRRNSSGEAVNEELGKKSAVNNYNDSKREVIGKRRESLPLQSPSRLRSASAHELHYTAKRAQTEEMRKKTFLPYRQGLLGCLGFSCKSYGMYGFGRSLSSR